MIERADKPSDRQEIKFGDELMMGGFLDLAKSDLKPLTRGGVYTATLAGRKVTFRIDPKAKTVGKAGSAPIVSRLLRFTSG